MSSITSSGKSPVSRDHTQGSRNSDLIKDSIEEIGALTEAVKENLRPIAAPLKSLVQSLHAYATGTNETTKIKESSSEIAEQAAKALRSINNKSGSHYQNIFAKFIGSVSKILNFFVAKEKTPEEDGPDIEPAFVEELIRFSAEHNGAIIKASTQTDPKITIRLKDAFNNNTSFDIERPIDLFKYVDSAYKRNKLMGERIDNKIKGLIYLAYCVKKYIESKAKFVASCKEFREDFNYKRGHLENVINQWNQAKVPEAFESKITDYRNISLSNEKIKLRQVLLDEFNSTESRKGKQIQGLIDPNKLFRFLEYTKEMQAVKYEATDFDYSNYNIVAQWFIQLGNQDPIISLSDYAEQQYGITDAKAKRSLARSKRDWNNKLVK